MMTLLAHHVVVALVSIKSEDERELVKRELTDPELNSSGHVYQIIPIGYKEIEGMCANMFNLVDKDSENALIMSERASKTYEKEHMQILRQNYKVMISNIDFIEYIGGGSTRCMLAEIF